MGFFCPMGPVGKSPKRVQQRPGTVRPVTGWLPGRGQRGPKTGSHAAGSGSAHLSGRQWARLDLSGVRERNPPPPGQGRPQGRTCSTNGHIWGDKGKLLPCSWTPPQGNVRHGCLVEPGRDFVPGGEGGDLRAGEGGRRAQPPLNSASRYGGRNGTVDSHFVPPLVQVGLKLKSASPTFDA